VGLFAVDTPDSATHYVACNNSLTHAFSSPHPEECEQVLNTQTISQIPVLSPSVYAFNIHGEVEKDDLAQMAEVMNEAFDTHDKVSMLLIFAPYDGAEPGAGLDLEVLLSQFRSILKVDKYAVVGAPSFATTMINVMDKMMPVEARTFNHSEEDQAWAFVGTSRG
jgi:SpoIIAA-like